MEPMKKMFPVLIALAAITACTDDYQELALAIDEQPNKTQPFQWTRAEDVETRSQFIRNFGVGYSYDAVRGTFCNWEDIRCQVVNRARVQELQERSGEQLLVVMPTNTVKTSGKYNYSMRDYVAAIHLDTKEELDLGLYTNTKRKRQDFLEDGVQEMFYYTLDEEIVKVNAFISSANIISQYERGNKNLLTQSFINSVKHLLETDEDDIAAVDSFLNVWGTHVIVEAWLGGKIRVDLMNDMWRYSDKGSNEEITTEEFVGACIGKQEHRENDKDFTWLEHSRLNITAMGGDQSTLTGLLGEHAPDGTRTFSTDGIAKWRTSIKYVPDDEFHSNVELVDMRVVPIWEFANAISFVAARRIKAVALQDAALQQQLLGDRNFFDAKFPIRYTKASCQYQSSTGKWTSINRTDNEAEPMVVNIVSGGRYVATVCHERINGVSLWVCYPIYEGKVKLACGLGVDDNNVVYKVRWINNAVSAIPTELKAEDGVFYINGGEVKVSQQEYVEYPPAQAIPYIELSGGVTPSGGYQSIAYNVTRNGADFELWLPEDQKPNNIVGWSYADITINHKNLYRRNPNYLYIYNQNEVK